MNLKGITRAIVLLAWAIRLHAAPKTTDPTAFHMFDTELVAWWSGGLKD